LLIGRSRDRALETAKNDLRTIVAMLVGLAKWAEEEAPKA
jgi:hypothetical protein